MGRALGLPAYRRLLGAYTLNELAWLAGSITLAVLVYRRTGSALGSTVFFLCSQFVPALIAPLVVARVDQRSVRRMLPLLYALQGIAFFALALLAGGSFVLGALLAIILAGGTAALVARSLLRATTVAVTQPAGLLREGNALANVAVSVCLLVGPGLGGLVVVAGGTRTVLFADSALFALIAVMLAADTALPAAEVAAAPTRWRDAYAHARLHPMILWILGIQAVAMVFFTISIPIEVVLAQHTLHAGPDGYGALVSVWGAGAIVGSALFARARRVSAARLIAMSSVSLAAGFWVMSLAPSLAVALAGALLGGFGNGLEAVAARTALQEQVEQRWMALIGSVNESMFQLTPGAGILLGGAITALAGPRVAFGVAGTGALAVAAAAWAILSRAGTPHAVDPPAVPVPVAALAPDGHFVRATDADGY